MTNVPPPGPLAYEGQVVIPAIVRPNQAPTSSNYQFGVPTVWVDPPNRHAYMLVAKPMNVADWIEISNTIPAVETLSGNSGGAVAPLNGNINLLGDVTTVNVAGNAGTHTLTITAGAGIAATYTTNAGVASPALGNLNILGANGITTSGAGSTVTVNLSVPLSVPHGGTGDITLASNGVLLGAGTSPVTSTSGTQGQVLTNNAGVPSFDRRVRGTGQFIFDDVTPADNATLLVGHQDNTNPGSNAILGSFVVGGGGNPFIGASISATRFYSYGILQASSNSWVLQTAANSAFTSGAAISIMTGSGYRTMPFQPAFLAYLSANDLNATGNGLTYSLGSGNGMTTIYDQSTSFSAAGVFTAPVTGRYCFRGVIYVTGMVAATTINMDLLTTSYTLPVQDIFVGGTFSSSSRFIATSAPLAAGDTAKFQLTVSGEAGNTLTIVGGNAPYRTYVSGELMY